MRVITGTARGRKLTAPDGIEIRPTTDMVKESIFSIIQFDIPGAAVLDLFAGTGQMGIEALSRGAASVSFVDSSKQAIAAIKQNLENTELLENAKIYPM
ncbi:MAG: RsmD family RNA methyltransferase, partial [Hydrogenoanaerobacterium sp.]